MYVVAVVDFESACEMAEMCLSGKRPDVINMIVQLASFQNA